MIRLRFSIFHMNEVCVNMSIEKYQYDDEKAMINFHEKYDISYYISKFNLYDNNLYLYRISE